MSGHRLYRYDVIRALAIMMVVGVHCIPSTTAPLLGPISCRSYDEACKTLFFTCNALFFMLSGRFNLRELGENEYSRYYYRRVRGVLLPTLVYLFIYTVVGLYPETGSVLHIAKTFVLNALGQLAHGIFWFVFALFGMLLVAPFIASSLLKLGKNGQRWFAWLWLLFQALTFLSRNLGFDFSWSYPLSGFFALFCVGSFIERSELNELDTRRLSMLFVTCWLSNALIAYLGWSAGAYDHSPLYAVTAMCLYLLLLRTAPGEGTRFAPVVSFVASHSFGIYLMHWQVYVTIEPFFSPLEYVWGPLYHLLLSVCVFALGLLLAVVCEHLLVRPLQHGLDLAYNSLRRADSPAGEK